MTGRSRILVEASALFSDGGGVPRPLGKSGVALERLRSIGEPVVLVGRVLGGRPLPDDTAERVAWVRVSLDVPWLRLAAFDEAAEGGGRATDPTLEHAVERWVAMRSSWEAETLITSHESSVGAARRAGLTVLRVGARGPGSDPTVPRADYEAIDLLDAVRHLMLLDTFDLADAGVSVPVPVSPSGGRGPATTAVADVLDGERPSDG